MNRREIFHKSAFIVMLAGAVWTYYEAKEQLGKLDQHVAELNEINQGGRALFDRRWRAVYGLAKEGLRQAEREAAKKTAIPFASTLGAMVVYGATRRRKDKAG